MPHNPKLPPLINGIVQKLINRDTIMGIVENNPTPFNIVLPEVFSQNIDSLRSVLNDNLDASSIYYAHKVNQADAFVTESHQQNIGVDVASLEELQHALYLGYKQDQIEATGPKSTEFLRVLVENKCIINIDSLDELHSIVTLTKNKKNIKQKLFVRLGEIDGVDRTSRFGLSKADTAVALELLRKHKDTLQFLGFAFHLDSSELRERVGAISYTLRWTKLSKNNGLSPTHINIGGGFRQRFTVDSEVWHSYVETLKLGILGKTESLTWDSNTFGFRP